MNLVEAEGKYRLYIQAKKLAADGIINYKIHSTDSYFIVEGLPIRKM